MEKKDWTITIETATFYFRSEKQMKRFISQHVTTGKDGRPALLRKYQYRNYNDFNDDGEEY